MGSEEARSPPSIEWGGGRGKTGASALLGTAPARVRWSEDSLFMSALGETADDGPGLAMDMVLEIGQRFFAALFTFLLLE